MKNKWPKRAPALLAAVALTASMFPTGALALEAERQDTAETVTAAVQQTPTPTIAVENVETGNTATPETAAEPETQLQEETVEQEEVRFRPQKPPHYSRSRKRRLRFRRWPLSRIVSARSG